MEKEGSSFTFFIVPEFDILKKFRCRVILAVGSGEQLELLK